MKSFAGHFAPVALVIAVALAWVQPAVAMIHEGDPEYQDMMGLLKEFHLGPYAPKPGETGVQGTEAEVDIIGPGAVLTVGNVFMKCTNYGADGNPWTNYSSDPSGQWKGASGIEYMTLIACAVGAVNPLATDPTAKRRVSQWTEWRPATLEPQDKMYRSYDGIVNGQRFVNDDGDRDPVTGEELIDEDFLDGRDNDGDGLIDEDFGALGQMMYTCVMRDDTQQAINASAAERHVPLGLELRKSDWAYSIPGYQDFDVIQWDIYNRSGHTLDSVVVGIRDDMDCGPVSASNYWADDFNLPHYPFGDFIIKTRPGDLRLQEGRIRADNTLNDDPHWPVPDVDADSALCPRYKVRVLGWSCVDDNGDDGKTPGVATVQLIDHTIDPLGLTGPTHVGLHSFRSYTNGLPYASGGGPTIDQQRYEMMTSTDPAVTNVDPATGFVADSYVTGDQKGDYAEWASVGPWMNWPDGGHLQVTLAFEVAEKPKVNGAYMVPSTISGIYTSDYALAYDAAAQGVPEGSRTASHHGGADLIEKYPSLKNALAAQLAFEGADESRPSWPWRTDFHGRETKLKAARGTTYVISNAPCGHDSDPRTVDENKWQWFDFDCNYCTGAYSVIHGGYFHRSWVAESPPPSPNTNLAVGYNYTDNPYRQFVPAGDHAVTVAWDNLSQTTPDPKSEMFDFRGFKIWKVSDWKRPVGSSGPSENDWTLLADFRLFDAYADNSVDTACSNPDTIAAGACENGHRFPLVYVPSTQSYKRIILHRGDLWNAQSGDVLRPDKSVTCTQDNSGNCRKDAGLTLAGVADTVTRYPVGRYHIVDREVKNGFMYFYSVTAYDSTGRGDQLAMLESRRSGVEAEGVVPQTSATTGSKAGSNVWVVPNPYRGTRQLSQRVSAWDLTPNASDPTGTHVDFFGLPRGDWSIEIYTVSGDLVQTLRASDPVNESIRTPATDPYGVSHPGYNRQADNPNDGQARWNLISRNGQDVVSGVYLFVVQAGGQVRHRGKFVIIR